MHPFIAVCVCVHRGNREIQYFNPIHVWVGGFFFSLISFRSFAHAFAYFYATKICARRNFGERTSCRYGEKPCLGNTKKKNYVGIRACGTVYIFLFLRVSSRTMNMRAHKRYVSHNIIRYDIQLLLLLWCRAVWNSWVNGVWKSISQNGVGTYPLVPSARENALRRDPFRRFTGSESGNFRNFFFFFSSVKNEKNLCRFPIVVRRRCRPTDRKKKKKKVDSINNRHIITTIRRRVFYRRDRRAGLQTTRRGRTDWGPEPFLFVDLCGVK